LLEKIFPSFDSGCVTHLVPALLGVKGSEERLPIDVNGSVDSSVLIILDGLGWEQLQDRKHLAPTLSSLAGGPITTVAPSTTSAALTSITTSLAPGQHGIIGYRFLLDDHILNALRWANAKGEDLRKLIPPEVVQPYDSFLGESVAYVAKAEFEKTGFTAASWRGQQLYGYRTTSTLVNKLCNLVSSGEKYSYCYYDGIDKVSHEYGFGDYFDAEIEFVDQLVTKILADLPKGTRVIISADHGQVDCSDNLIKLPEQVTQHVSMLSGEGRFRWLHCEDNVLQELFSICNETFGHQSWVHTKQELIDLGLFGNAVSRDVADRMGDIALLPFENIAYDDPLDTGSFSLIGRHGSLTPAEMFVPCLTTIT